MGTRVGSLTHRIDLLVLPYLELVLEYNPVLKESTPALITSATEQASTLAAYLASFSLAQLLLKASDFGLETADSLLKLVEREEVKLVQEGLRKIRAGANYVRKEGVVRNGSEKVQSLEDASLLDAAATVLGLDFIFLMLGVQGLVNKPESKKPEATGQEVENEGLEED